MRTKIRPILLAAAAASAASCNALLGLDDKVFDRTPSGPSTTSSSGTGGSGGAASSSASVSSSSVSSSSSSSGGGGSGGGAVSYWVRSSSASSNMIPPAIGGVATDSNGKIWVTGAFTDHLTMADCVDITTSASQAIFWARFDQNGNCEDAQTIGGSNLGYAGATGIAIDSKDRPVIVGSFSDKLGVSPWTLDSKGKTDIFAIELETTGAVRWAQSIGDVGDDGANAVAIDQADDVVMAGSFTGPITVMTPGMAALLPGVGMADAIVLELSHTDGKPIGVQSFGSMGVDSISAVAISSTGDTIGVSGTFAADMKVFGTTLQTMNQSAFAAVFTLNPLTLKLAVAGKATTYTNGLAAAMDQGGMTFAVGGEFSGTMDFGTPMPATTYSGDIDGFVGLFPSLNAPLGKLGRLGQPSPGSPGAGPDSVRGMTWDRSTNTLLMVGSVSPGSSFLGTSVMSAGEKDVFVAKSDNKLGLKWAKRFGDALKDQEASAVAVDPSSNVIVAGPFVGDLDVGYGPKVSTGATGEIFVAKLPP